MRPYFALTLFVLAAAAQTPTASVTGAVRDSTSGAPAAGARIEFGRWTATTDAEGRFSIQAVDPGRYWITATDDVRAGFGGAYATVSIGNEPTKIEIAMNLGGYISGRVLDEERRPIEGAAVVALTPVFSQGALAYTPAEKTKTNRSGEYRLGRLRAGRRYLVLAKKVLRTHPAADPAARDTVLLPTYFPGTPRVEQSEPVIVSPSENRSGVDIRLASGPWFCIEGEVSAPMPSLQIFENMPLTQGWKFEPVTVKPDSEGRFAACGFHSGEYRLSAAAGSAGRDMIAAYAEAEITTHDLRGLRVPVRTPVTIAGETAWDPTPVTEVAANLNISLTTSSVRSNYADGDVPSSGYVFGMNSVSKIAVPGEFNLGSWPADDYTLSVSGIPAGCYLKDALWGTTSVLHRPLRIERGFGGDVRLRIVLACDAGSITAHVTDHDGAPVSNGNLYLFPSTADTPAAMQEMLRRARVQKGWSEFRRIPPGRYFALACDLELDGTAEPILKLWDARWRGKEFEVSGNATVQITLERMRVE